MCKIMHGHNRKIPLSLHYTHQYALYIYQKTEKHLAFYAEAAQKKMQTHIWIMFIQLPHDIMPSVGQT